jgi:hypothetical protein
MKVRALEMKVTFKIRMRLCHTLNIHQKTSLHKFLKCKSRKAFYINQQVTVLWVLLPRELEVSNKAQRKTLAFNMMVY